MDAAQSSRSSGSRPWKCLRVQYNFGLGAFRRRARSRSSCARHLNRLDVRPMRHSILGARFDANDEAAASANRTANVTFVPDPHAAIMLTSTTSLRLDSKPLRSRGRSPSSRVMGRRSARTVVYSRAALAKRIPSAIPPYTRRFEGSSQNVGTSFSPIFWTASCAFWSPRCLRGRRR